MSTALARRSDVDAAPAVADLSALGVAVRLAVTEAASLADARRLLIGELERLDQACSRFRPDSELVAVNRQAGRPVAITPFLAEAIGVGLDAAHSSHGDVDPTLGASLVRLGYDQDFSRLPAEAAPVALSIWRGSCWDQVELDRQAGTVRVPAGVEIDLGATAKAWCADLAATSIHHQLGGGVLVSLGGDIAVAGQAPRDGWAVRAQDRPGLPEDDVDGPSATVAIRAGGLATSSTAARRWRRGGRSMHHVLDPRTGMPAVSVWRTVTVSAPTCLAANVATTAAIVRSQGAVAGLSRAGLPARLVSRTGEVTCLNGWPEEVDHEQR